MTLASVGTRPENRHARVLLYILDADVGRTWPRCCTPRSPFRARASSASHLICQSWRRRRRQPEIGLHICLISELPSGFGEGFRANLKEGEKEMVEEDQEDADDEAGNNFFLSSGPRAELAPRINGSPTNVAVVPQGLPPPRDVYALKGERRRRRQRGRHRRARRPAGERGGEKRRSPRRSPNTQARAITSVCGRGMSSLSIHSLTRTSCSGTTTRRRRRRHSKKLTHMLSGGGERKERAIKGTFFPSSSLYLREAAIKCLERENFCQLRTLQKGLHFGQSRGDAKGTLIEKGASNLIDLPLPTRPFLGRSHLSSLKGSNDHIYGPLRRGERQ